MELIILNHKITKKEVLLFIIIIEFFIFLFGKKISNIMNIYSPYFANVIIVILIITFSLYIFIIYSKHQTHKYDVYYCNQKYSNLIKKLEKELKMKKYVQIPQDCNNKDDNVLFFKKKKIDLNSTYLLLFNGNRYNFTIINTLQKKGYIGNYCIINYVFEPIEESKIEDFLFFNEQYLTIFFNIPKKEIYIANTTSGYYSHLLFFKKYLNKIFDIKFKYKKILEKK
jgi:hypothetical protein